MPVTVEISENGRVVRTNISDPWTIDELIAVTGRGRTHRDSVNFKVHSLIDLSHAVRVPPGALRARFTSGFSHPNSGKIVVFGATAFARSLLEVMGNLVRSGEISFFETEAEAVNYLNGLAPGEQSDPVQGKLSKSA